MSCLKRDKKVYVKVAPYSYRPVLNCDATHNIHIQAAYALSLTEKSNLAVLSRYHGNH